MLEKKKTGPRDKGVEGPSASRVSGYERSGDDKRRRPNLIKKETQGKKMRVCVSVSSRGKRGLWCKMRSYTGEPSLFVG